MSTILPPWDPSRSAYGPVIGLLATPILLSLLTPSLAVALPCSANLLAFSSGGLSCWSISSMSSSAAKMSSTSFSSPCSLPSSSWVAARLSSLASSATSWFLLLLSSLVNPPVPGAAAMLLACCSRRSNSVTHLANTCNSLGGLVATPSKLPPASYLWLINQPPQPPIPSPEIRL